ncbi:aldose 1-epimerase family protein [Lachnospira multipara]|uniref:Galactose mutarotase n=1 Tax=Lachnospira multipara TaxID=28051 RepID=A0A1H5W738_9FIRM|nr:aldose 1-epimerase family protein [Lachnospira multipara]SEF95223.1 Galactose mutarotase [Lachnospira multipara]
MEFFIENDELKLTVNSKGCEIKSVKSVKTGEEYMWSANPEAWKRTAPILFPIVGKYADNESIYEGKTYTMTQHGFARDKEFTLVENANQKLVMKLESDEETKAKYPFDFELYVEYDLAENAVTKKIKVVNKDTKTMYFSLGGHPAFVCPDLKESQAGVKICFEKISDEAKGISYKLLSENGLLVDEEYKLPLNENSEFEVDKTFFDKDALILENKQASKISLDYKGRKYVTVEFDAPVFGLWSAAKKDVPFICIEPWYGRTDKEGFNKDLTKREWGNELAVGQEFNASYKVSFN